MANENSDKFKFIGNVMRKKSDGEIGREGQIKSRWERYAFLERI